MTQSNQFTPHDRQAAIEAITKTLSFVSDEDEKQSTSPLDTPNSPRSPIRRLRSSMQRFPVFHGHVVLTQPVPTRLLDALPSGSSPECKSMRYTAATCDPNDFVQAGYNLRAHQAQREVEIAVCITMYNEDEVMLAKTLDNVIANVEYLCTKKKHPVFACDGWKKVIIFIVSDGRKAIHPKVLASLGTVGVYQPDIAKDAVEYGGQETPVTAHLFEYTTQFSLTPDKKLRVTNVPIQLVFCLKEINAKKLNSHRWFFNAFCPLLKPTICVLLDAGTAPDRTALYQFWKTFDENADCGGACGQLLVDSGKMQRGLLNPLVAAQNFEYKVANLLDKPTEAMAGFISVLPGAFSAYRYKAVSGVQDGKCPLDTYFQGEKHEGSKVDVWTANMYLAEDRILGFEIVSQKDHRWLLHYIKSISGTTDVPQSATDLIAQRRRWLNGSTYATLYALTHYGRLLKTNHSLTRKMGLTFLFVYNTMQLFFSWFAIGNLFVVFYLFSMSLEFPAYNLRNIRYSNIVFQTLYCVTLASSFALSVSSNVMLKSSLSLSSSRALGNRPKASKFKYTLVISSFVLLTLYLIATTIMLLYFNLQHSVGGFHSALDQLLPTLLSTYGAYLLSGLIALDMKHIVTSYFQYMIMQPIYINVLEVYAVCNLSDVSWGTKGLDKAEHLGVVHLRKTTDSASEDSASLMEMALPASQAEIDLAYQEKWEELFESQSEPDASLRDTLTQDDYYRSVRTNTMMLWIASNVVVAILVLFGRQYYADAQGIIQYVKAVRIYMFILLGFMSLTAIVRLLASTVFLACIPLNSLRRKARRRLRKPNSGAV